MFAVIDGYFNFEKFPKLMCFEIFDKEANNLQRMVALFQTTGSNFLSKYFCCF